MFVGAVPLVAVPLDCCAAELDPKLKGDCVACRFTSPNKPPPLPALVPAGIEGADPLLVVLVAPGKLKRLPLPWAPAEDVVGACPVDDEAAVLKIFEGGLPAGVVLNVRPEERGGCGVVVPLADLLPPPRFEKMPPLGADEVGVPPPLPPPGLKMLGVLF